MTSDSKNIQLDESEIDLKLIFVEMINKKKLVIFTTIFFTLVASIFSIQKSENYSSTALIEIGVYDEELIEAAPKLIESLNFEFIYKKKLKEYLKFDNLANGISVKLTSSSLDNHDDILNEIIEYIKLRHEKKINQKHNSASNILTNNINQIEATLTDFSIIETDLKNYLSDSNTENNILLLEARVNLESRKGLLLIEQKRLQGELELLNKISKHNSSVGNIETTREKSQSTIYMLIGFFIGLFVSIFIILFNMINIKPNT